jgi:hypothetical protein
MKMKNGQTWLFSFTDLAFLLLISLSLIPSAPDNITIKLAEMDVPVVPEHGRMDPLAKVRETWELQVYALSEKHPTPYRLIRVGVGKNVGQDDERILTKEELLPALIDLKKRNIRPMLLPEKKSLSQDFLYAAGVLAKVWTDGTRAVVQTETEGGESAP